ncbi:hypothetical protein RB195_014334 [Necator americanus]|uniref:Reverse transcriptase domain-containing protein n=1 Tax=Necator americanus TaxID=51031 RepID=A0ABR1DZQ4_NECAM
MLPRLCDILLRFRIGNIAITSDVEKAFPQDHLQDRDVTRFLWLKNQNSPVIPSKMVTYRLSRVTFGLICSPFLLAGKIKYHLENHAQNNYIAREIEINTYVDNVILTSNSTEGALLLYKKSRMISEDIKMNLREFLSNDDYLQQQIAEKDLSKNPRQKNLGNTVELD